jgi:hypothetical protein
MMMVKGLDKEVEKCIRFWEKQSKSIILVTEEDGWYYMTVMYPGTNKVIDGISLCETRDNKCNLMMAIRRFFKGNSYLV